MTILSKLVDIGAGFKRPLIAIALFMGAMTCSFGAGYLIAQTHEAKAHVVEVKREGEKAVEAVVQQTSQAQVIRIERSVRDIERERQLTTQLDGVRSERDNLQRLLNEKPDPDLDVHIRIGDLRMLNDAATRALDVTAGVSDPARVAAYQEQTPSDVSLRQFVGVELSIRAQYNELAATHDALVDWVQVELIDHQLATSKTVADGQFK